MKLGDWLSETNRTQTWLAAEIGVTQGRISQIVRGGGVSLELAAKIHEITDGAVSFGDLLREAAE